MNLLKMKRLAASGCAVLLGAAFGVCPAAAADGGFSNTTGFERVESPLLTEPLSAADADEVSDPKDDQVISEDGIFRIELPDSPHLTIDPYGLKRNGQIFSEPFTISNFSSFPVLMEWKSVFYSISSEKLTAGGYGCELRLYDENGEIGSISETASADFPTAVLPSGGSLTYTLRGEVDPGSEALWEDGSLAISVSLEFKNAVSTEEEQKKVPEETPSEAPEEPPETEPAEEKPSEEVPEETPSETPEEPSGESPKDEPAAEEPTGDLPETSPENSSPEGIPEREPEITPSED